MLTSHAIRVFDNVKNEYVNIGDKITAAYDHYLQKTGQSLVPYVVRMFSMNWIPCNVLVYAVNQEGAIERLLNALEERAKRQGPETPEHSVHLWNEYKGGNLEIICEPLDILQITQISWADNDTI